jgi:DNA polymerase-4
MNNSARRILHIDMDAFFVAIERRDDPSLLGKPVVVGGSGPRGVVSSASYEARAYGVHSGLSSAKAKQLCPELIFVSTNGEKYGIASRQVREILGEYSPDVDFTSVDEGYVDITGTGRLFGKPLSIASEIRQRVEEETHCSASIGIAGTRLCAKVASKFAKPAGIIEITPNKESDFLRPLPLKLLPGAGGVTGKRLEQFGVTEIGQLHDVGEQFLKRSFGAAGTDLFMKSAGGGISYGLAQSGEGQRKSVGHERTFSEDTIDFAFLERVLFRLSERSCRTLRDEGLVARCTTLKIRLSDFRTFTRSYTTITATDADLEVFAIARRLLRQFKLPRIAIRLIGVSLSNLSKECQWGLFNRTAKLWKLYQGLDNLRDSYGQDAVVSGLVFDDSTTERFRGKFTNPFLGPRYEKGQS